MLADKRLRFLRIVRAIGRMGEPFCDCMLPLFGAEHLPRRTGFKCTTAGGGEIIRWKGQTAWGTPQAIGSMMFWQPVSTKLPPTKAISAAG